MRHRSIVVFSLFFAWASFSSAQSPPAPFPLGNPQSPQTNPKTPDLSKLSQLQRQFYFCVQRGAEWLQRNNRPNGRFRYGLLPALQRTLPGDNFLHQTGAALALTRAAQWQKEPRGMALAKQSALSLLAETAPSNNIQQVRYTVAPSTVTNRLASAGILAALIYEIPTPGQDLLLQAEQLTSFIRLQQKKDGSLSWTPHKTTDEVNAEGIRQFTGLALHGLAVSHRKGSAQWKLDVLRKACTFYHAWWKSHRNMAMIPEHTAAFSEAYLVAKDARFLEYVFAMNDWLCEQQYDTVAIPQWIGGFKTEQNGKLQSLPPTIETARFAESLAHACRVARDKGDVARFQRYRQGLERALQFVSSLQFTNANCQHFTPLYRPMIVGGFHASHQDSRLRIDYNQHAVSAFVLYFQHTADVR